jgi:predicted transcriptional regulator
MLAEHLENKGGGRRIHRCSHEALPDDATWQDLVYALELRGDVEAGLADAKAGRVTDSEDLRREYGRHR